MSLKIVLTFCITFALWTSVNGKIVTIYGDWNVKTSDCYTEHQGCKSNGANIKNVTENLRDVMSNTTSVRVYGTIELKKGSKQLGVLSVLPLNKFNDGDGLKTFVGEWNVQESSNKLGYAFVQVVLYVSQRGTVRLEYTSCVFPTSQPCFDLSINLTSLEIHV